jgi:hypothetical protein
MVIAMKKLDELVAQFADNIGLQNGYMRAGDARKGNQHARKIVKAFESLCERGDEGRNALKELFDDPRTDVRATAACFLLRYCTEEAEKVLLEISTLDNFTGFEAGECLKRWREGTWELDPG